jgi:hypothetical protein
MIMESRVANFATSKNLTVKSFHIVTFIKLLDGKTHNQLDHILIDRRLHSSILDVWWESQKERDHWEDHGIGGWTILKWILEIGWNGVDWIDIAQDRDQ